MPDPDGDLAEGDILIDSELLLPASPELGAGTRTRRITTVHSGPAHDARERVVDHLPTPAAAPPCSRDSSTTTTPVTTRTTS